MNPSEAFAPSTVAADQAIATVRAGDLRRALSLARQVAQMGRTQGDAAFLAALNALAIVQGASGHFIEAIASSLDACELANRLGDRRGVLHAAVTVAGVGTFFLEADSITEALLAQCRRAALELNDDVQMVRLDCAAGLFFMQARRFDEAQAAFEQALAHPAAADSRVWFITPKFVLSGNLAYLAVYRIAAAPADQRPALAVPATAWIEQALTVARAHGNVDSEARALYVQGLMHIHLGDVERALADFERVMDITRRLGHVPRMVDTLLEIGKALRLQGNHTKALAALDEAFSLAETVRPTARLAAICEALAALHGELGQSHESVLFIEKAASERAAHAAANVHALRDLNSFTQRLHLLG
jgi:tetratricopeptide (TPR) repeat protein